MFVEIFTFCFDSRVMHFMFDLTHFKQNTKQTSNIWSVKVDFLSDSVKREILRYSFKVLNAVFAFVWHKCDNRNVIMMCFLAADLVWLLAGLCHALGINTQVGAAVTTAEMLDFFPPLYFCTQSSCERGRGWCYCEFPQKQPIESALHH